MLYIVQVNFFSFIILAFIFLQILKSKNPLSNEKQYYLWVVITTAFVVLLDIILQFINGTPGPFLHNLHLFLVYLFYVFNPVPFFLWTALIWEYLSKQHAKNSLLMIAYATPAIIYFVLATMSIFNQSLFIVDAANEYARGPYFHLLTLVDSFYAFMGLMLVIYSYSKLLTNDLLVMVLSYLIPFIGGAMQALNYGVYTLWPSVTISILLIYFFILKENAFTRNILKTNSSPIAQNETDHQPNLWD